MKPVLGSKGRSEVGEEVTRNGDLKMWSVISSVSTFDNTKAGIT
jgi:hypothetical protein